jgi:hypothetical protein
MKALLRVGVVVMAACFGLAPVARAETVTLLGGPVGGVWYIVAAGMAKIIHDSYPDILVRVEPGGAVTNPARVSQGTADFALAISTPTVMALRGTGVYHESFPNIQAIGFGFAPSYVQVICTKNFPYPSFEAAIKAKYAMRIAAPSTATLGDLMMQQMLQHYGVTPDMVHQWGGNVSFVSHNQQQDLMRNGQANVLMTLLPAPGTDISLVASSINVKFLPLSDSLLNMFVKEDATELSTLDHSVYPDVIPAGEKVNTIVIDSGLIVSPKVPEQTVYKVTRALFEHADEVAKIHPSIGAFVPADLARPGSRGNGAIPLAPGAEQYFKEMKYDYKVASDK